MKFAAHLRALIAGATKLPWRTERQYTDNGSGFQAVVNSNYEHAIDESGIQGDDNLKFILFLANHAAALAAVVETTENFMLHPDDAGMMAISDALAALHVGQTGE